MTYTPIAPVNPKVVERISELDVEPAIHYLRELGDRPWPRHVAREVALEFRRLVIMQLENPEVDFAVGPLLQEFAAAFALTSSGKADFPVGTPLGSDREATEKLYVKAFNRPLPATWFTEDLEKFLGSSQPGIVG